LCAVSRWNSAARQLLRDGREVSLSPKAFQLLSLLVVNPSARRVEAGAAPDALASTFVLDTNIASLIAEIRRALDDDAATPQVHSHHAPLWVPIRRLR
jgi:DNA-binding winged helix-turn-helix (wHTH) protein